MAEIVFDTNICIAYNFENLPDNMVLSAIVLQELLAGAKDRSALKRLEASKRRLEKEGKFLVPTGEDWLKAGRILHSLSHNLKTESGGKTPRLQPNKIQQMFRDTLIATSVHRIHGLLVTDNLSDFEAIQRYCKVRIQSGKDFFDSF